jgi:RHS repeat-associated protein
MRVMQSLLLVALFPVIAAAQSTTQVVEYYTTDALGSVRAVTKQVNGQWQVVARHDFMPFGGEVAPPIPPQEKRLFTGKERDTETELDYFGARYYRANVGRFTTIDPVYTWQENLEDPQRWNRYAYARNNPLKYVDPDGRAIDTIFDIASIAYDLYKIAREGATRTNVLALGADVGAAVIPFATGGGAAVRAGARGIEEGAHLVQVNRAAGKAFEAEVAHAARKELSGVAQQVTIKTAGGRTVMDVAGRDAAGNVVLVEAKGSATARLSRNQAARHAEIEQTGGVVVGAGKPGMPGGTQIPPGTRVKVVRPEDLREPR